MDTIREPDAGQAGTVVTPDQPRQEVPSWRLGLPSLCGRSVLLREPTREDVVSLAAILGDEDAPRFGIIEPLSQRVLSSFIDRTARHEPVGPASPTRSRWADGAVVGLLQVRQLDSSFETAECECLFERGLRGRAAFLEAARLAGSFAFDAVGARRLESRVMLADRRANIALRQLGAVQEAVLRRSMRRGPEYVDQALWAVMKEDWCGGPPVPISHWIH